MPTADGQLTAAEIAQLYVLVQAQARIRSELTRAAVRGAVLPFQALRSWYDPVDVLLAILDALRVTQAAQRRMAQVTDAYLARTLTVMTGEQHRPVGAVDVTTLRRQLTPQLARVVQRDPVPLEPEGELDLAAVFEDDDEPDRDRGVDEGLVDEVLDEDDLRDVSVRPIDPVDVYERVAAEYRWQVSRGSSEGEARQAALERAAVIADMDVMLAAREQEHRVLRVQNRSRIVGYRRILHPELSETGPCGLCIVAADRRYKIENLKPIHGRCRCSVMPITRGADPGLRLNQEDLKRLYEAAGGTTSGRALKRVRAVVTEHGELGPILAEAPKSSRGLRGPAAAAEATGRRKYDPEARIASLERSVEYLRRRAADGDPRVAAAIRYNQRRLEELRAELAEVS